LKGLLSENLHQRQGHVNRSKRGGKETRIKARTTGKKTFQNRVSSRRHMSPRRKKKGRSCGSYLTAWGKGKRRKRSRKKCSKCGKPGHERTLGERVFRAALALQAKETFAIGAARRSEKKKGASPGPVGIGLSSAPRTPTTGRRREEKRNQKIPTRSLKRREKSDRERSVLATDN